MQENYQVGRSKEYGAFPCQQSSSASESARRAMGELLTIAEAAAFLRLKPSTVRAWVLRRKLPYCKVGRLIRIRRMDVEALIAESLVAARAENPTGTKRQPKVKATVPVFEQAAGVRP